MSRMTFNEAAKRRMLQGDLGLVQGERGIAVKYDKLAFRLEGMYKPDGPTLVIGLFSGAALLNEVSTLVSSLTAGHTVFISGLEGHMYLTNEEITGLAK